MRHAFLILAHNEFEILKLLVSRLDDVRNDIFIHFDRKVAVLPEIKVKEAGLTILEDRKDVRWGGFSMIEAEYALFEAAAAKGPYQYYHLLSGVDLPLKSQDCIHGFFDAHDGKEFIGYTWTEMPREFVRKMRRWHLFPEEFKSRNIFKKAFRAGFIRFQEAFGIIRNKNVDFKKGSQWVSITDGMIHYLLDHKDWVRKTFRNTFSPDELVVQTLCRMSPFRDNIFNTTDDATGCMRAISWRENPGSSEMVLKDWSAEDYGLLKESPALFARKFNSSDMGFINKILELSK
ncbi:MAG: glycosyl transferase [Bacteroidales bacterium]|nr:glycosyl transferase [Bacteroidales bacterium]